MAEFTTESTYVGSVSGRQWPVPTRPWILRMRWYDLLFAHWPVRVEQVRPQIPSRLEVDTWDGRAWIGVVPFRMSGIAPRGFPDLPLLSRFDELNVRTYVTVDGKPGVWFYSLDATNPIAVNVARWTFHLPYLHAKMKITNDGTAIHYLSQRRVRNGAGVLDIRYSPCSPVQASVPGSLEAWLTERYCLYAADGRQRIYRGEIDHAPWPLQLADAEIRYNSMLQACGVELPSRPPLLHFAKQLDVVAWTLNRLEIEQRETES